MTLFVGQPGPGSSHLFLTDKEIQMGDDAITAACNILKGSLKAEPAAPVDVLVGGTTSDQVTERPASVTELYDQLSGAFGETISEFQPHA